MKFRTVARSASDPRTRRVVPSFNLVCASICLLHRLLDLGVLQDRYRRNSRLQPKAPLSGAYCPFVGPTLKGSEGPGLRARCFRPEPSPWAEGALTKN
jgi:hypothetical protein